MDFSESNNKEKECLMFMKNIQQPCQTSIQEKLLTQVHHKKELIQTLLIICFSMAPTGRGSLSTGKNKVIKTMVNSIGSLQFP